MTARWRHSQSATLAIGFLVCTSFSAPAQQGSNTPSVLENAAAGWPQVRDSVTALPPPDHLFGN